MKSPIVLEIKRIVWVFSDAKVLLWSLEKLLSQHGPARVASDVTTTG
jgi:hypothetical protein